jgi:hypothetical protein
VNEKRNGFLPSGNIAINPRRLFPVLGFIVDAKFGLASQILRLLIQVIIQIIVGRLGSGSRGRAGRTTGSAFLARAAVARTPIPGATTSAAPPTAARPFGIFRSAFLSLFVTFFESPLIEGGICGQLLEFVIGGAFFAPVRLRLVLFARSFVVHSALPIHRSRGSVSSRT